MNEFNQAKEDLKSALQRMATLRDENEHLRTMLDDMRQLGQLSNDAMQRENHRLRIELDRLREDFEALEEAHQRARRGDE